MIEFSTSRERVAGRSPKTGASRRPAWVEIATPILLVVLMFACRGESASDVAARTTSSGETVPQTEAAVAASQSPKAERSVPDSQARESIVGWWLRHDQSYMIVIDSVDESGRVEARYLNPRPVNVSKAEAWIEEGILRLLVELTDENYPGNYYELVYRAREDAWVGVYHHLGNDETYEVYFMRFEGDSGDGES